MYTCLYKYSIHKIQLCISQELSHVELATEPGMPMDSAARSVKSESTIMWLKQQ